MDTKMKTISILMLLPLAYLTICEISVSGMEDSAGFVDTDADFKRMHRNLLQVDDLNEPDDMNEQEDEEKEVIREKEQPKGIITPGQDELGDTLFYTGNEEGGFLMQLDKPIEIVLKSGDKYSLGEKAASIQGSRVKTDIPLYEYTIDWKNKQFGVISDVQISMEFNISNSEFSLLDLKVDRIRINGQTTIIDMQVKTEYGYHVYAPIGTAFACTSPGMFKPTSDGSPLAGIIFPGIKLQVLDIPGNNFGPLWECGELMPIGLWVGLIVTVFYAIICCCGFSMLANIQTMDRFDDPKGKNIHIPQTD